MDEDEVDEKEEDSYLDQIANHPNPHLSYAGQVVELYHNLMDLSDDATTTSITTTGGSTDSGGGIMNSLLHHLPKEEEGSSSIEEVVRRISQRWSSQDREDAHRRAMKLADSIATTTWSSTSHSPTTRSSTSTRTPTRRRKTKSSAPWESLDSSNHSIPNQLCSILSSSRAADYYIESLFETVETNWFCVGLAGGGTWGATTG